MFATVIAMKILIIGSGGREHAIGLKLASSRHTPTLFFAPGNAGTDDLGTNIALKDTDLDGLLTFAKENQIDLTVVGPEQPLVDGIVDLFESENCKIVGPSKAGAQLEGSKDWAKQMMQRAGIPTARFETFTDYSSSSEYILSRNTYPIVIKADGLAAGKGVTVAQSESEALEALKDCFESEKFGQAGLQVVIEDFLKGQEASIFAFTDGKTIVPMIPAQDHKAAYDGDTGPNTGGMGSYAPAPIATQAIQETTYKTVFTPLLEQFQKEGISYKGIVYAGLMIDTDNSVNIVEFNVRFGDPETQIVLPQLETDLIDVFLAMCDQRLADIDITWSNTPSVCVVMASKGYPNAYEKGKQITSSALPANGSIVYAGAQKNEQGHYLTSGGRVLVAIGQGETLQDAVNTAYQTVDCIQFDGAFYRTDIAHKAL